MKMQGRTEEKQEEGIKQNNEMKEKMNKKEEGHKAQYCSSHYPDSRVVPNSMCGQNVEFLSCHTPAYKATRIKMAALHWSRGQVCFYGIARFCTYSRSLRHKGLYTPQQNAVQGCWAGRPSMQIKMVAQSGSYSYLTARRDTLT
jgi:hypothetical protein